MRFRHHAMIILLFSEHHFRGGCIEMFEIIYSNLGGLLIALIAVILGYWAIRSNRKFEEQKLIFEEKKFQAE